MSAVSREVPAPASVHASAVLVGPRAVLIRGPAGSGKSRLVLDLIDAARAGFLPFSRLVSDDRTQLSAAGGRVLARPAEALAGLIEVRGLGIRRLPFEPVAVVGLIVDLAASDAARLPAVDVTQTSIAGVALPRLPVAPGPVPTGLVLAALRSAESGVAADLTGVNIAPHHRTEFA